ncbi:hypothetical protein NMY22_g4112 [Coprinellus aureogranulatus]|nr:hypothetical protein NMY22_g4112 [Coprinellus aureogranulatus]
MFFKLSSIVVAAATAVSAGSATCRFQTTYFGTSPSTDVAVTDWNYFVGRSLAAELVDGTPVQVGSSTIAPGPGGAENNFFITNTVGADPLTDAGVAALIGTWPGRTFQGQFSGVTWHVDNVSCQ